jgi:hypothetical protein
LTSEDVVIMKMWVYGWGRAHGPILPGLPHDSDRRRIDLSKELQNLISKRFIARSDVKAVQIPNGEYRPVESPFTREDLAKHLARESTFGHYMLDRNNNCKLIAFDVDLEHRSERNPVGWVPTDEDFSQFVDADPREVWHDRSNKIGRAYLKLELRTAAHVLVRAVEEMLGVPVAAAYSGGKGVHVYAFTGSIPAGEAREGAEIVLGSLEQFSLYRGNNFFRVPEPKSGGDFSNISIEIYPKQETINQEKKWGNLMRLPLGRNQKTKDPTFFMDMTSAMGQMLPIDPLLALSDSYNPWASVSD